MKEGGHGGVDGRGGGARFGGGRFFTSLAAACAVTVLLTWLSGLANDEVEVSIFWDIVWLIPGNATGLYMMFAVGRRLTKELEKGTPVLICLSHLIRAASTDRFATVTGLFFAIVATVCCYVMLLGHHTTEWLEILCINATFWSTAILTIMTFCMAFRNSPNGAAVGLWVQDHPSVLSLVALIVALGIGSQLPYGPAIKVIATVTNFSGLQSIVWYFYDFLRDMETSRGQWQDDTDSSPRTDSALGSEAAREMEKMDANEVVDLLVNNGYMLYAEIFEKHEVNGSHLARLSATDLEKMGVHIVGHQLDLLKLFSQAASRRR